MADFWWNLHDFDIILTDFNAFTLCEPNMAGKSLIYE
jgi:hypothetical protein